MEKLTLKKLNFLCKSLMNWDSEKVEMRFYGERKEIVKELNSCSEQEIELFLSGFFCENPIVEALADGQIDIEQFSAAKKVQIFIRRGLMLCYLTNHEPGLVVKPYWKEQQNL